MAKDFRDRIRDPNCELCPLHEGAEYRCLMGSGPVDAQIMVIGEAPGAREDESHKAFVGPAGALLTELLEKAGLSRDEVYITNVCKCRPPDNRTPDRREIKRCVSTYLAQELEAVSPSHILLLGNSALTGVVGRSGITKHRGKVYTVGDSVALPTFHPAAVLRNPRLRSEVEADIQRFARLSRGESSKLRTRVRIIRNTKQLRWLRRQLMKAEVIAFDLETTGLEEWRPDAKIVSLGVAWKPAESCVVPIHHRATPWKGPSKVLAYLKPCLERSGVRYVAHNAKFDARWLAANGIFVPVTFDTMLAAHMLDENRSKSLKTLSQVILAADAYDIGEDVRDAYNAPLKRLCIYNAKDCDYTLRLYSIFKAQLLKEKRLARVFTRLMMPASDALTRVERAGLWVDHKRLKARTVSAEGEAETIRLQMIDEYKAPEDLNFNSPQQVGEWLFGTLGLPVIEETPKGAASTRESVLLKLAKQHPAPRLMLKYRQWSKYLSTYLLPWRENLDDRNRLHTTYKLFGTVTGRLSSEGPNLQQVPRDPFIRSILGAPPGWLFVEADYSQVELRIAAMLAGERRMLRAFHQGVDIHLQTAVEMTGKLPADVTSEERKKAKAVNFGFLYGMGWRKFIEYAADNYDLEVSDGEARSVRDKFFESYPSLRAWHDRQRRLAHRYQRVSSPIGRIRHLPDVRSGNEDVQAEAERQAINSPVQSMASDLMLLGLSRLSSALPSRSGRIVGTVHDALLFEVKEDTVDEVLPTIRRVMEDTEVLKGKFNADITVPIEVELKVGQHWGEGKVWDSPR